MMYIFIDIIIKYVNIISCIWSICIENVCDMKSSLWILCVAGVPNVVIKKEISSTA